MDTLLHRGFTRKPDSLPIHTSGMTRERKGSRRRSRKNVQAESEEVRKLRSIRTSSTKCSRDKNEGRRSTKIWGCLVTVALTNCLRMKSLQLMKGAESFRLSIQVQKWARMLRIAVLVPRVIAVRAMVKMMKTRLWHSPRSKPNQRCVSRHLRTRNRDTNDKIS